MGAIIIINIIITIIIATVVATAVYIKTHNVYMKTFLSSKDAIFISVPQGTLICQTCANQMHGIL